MTAGSQLIPTGKDLASKVISVYSDVSIILTTVMRCDHRIYTFLQEYSTGTVRFILKIYISA